jgi:predicted amidohydrolase YtcJ
VGCDTLLVGGAVLKPEHLGQGSGAQHGQPAIGYIGFRGGVITAMGEGNPPAELVSSSLEVLDVSGHSVFPGFFDAHIHVWKVGQLLTSILDLRGVRSFVELRKVLAEAAKRANFDQQWIVGRGLNESLLAEGRLPIAADLDDAVADRPVYLQRTCGHIAMANSVALKLANLNAQTKDPAGGTVCRDQRGNPTGVLWETAMGLVSRHVPKADHQSLCQGIQAAARELAKFGVTGACEPGVNPEVAAAYLDLDRQNKLNLRCQVMALHVNDEGSDLYPLPAPHRSGMLRFDTVKYFADGGLSGGTAALSRPYKNESSTGVMRMTRAQMSELISLSFAKDYNVAIHGIGDAAIAAILQSFRDCLSLRGNRTMRLEHCGLPTAEHMRELVELNVGITTQPIFIRELGTNFRQRIDDDFLAKCYPVRDLLEAGVNCAFSTDAPVVNVLSPWEVMQAGILRQDSEGVVIGRDQAVTLSQGVYAYTAIAADVCGFGAHVGKLEIGKAADVAVWKGNPLALLADELLPFHAELTFVNGKCVHDGGNLRRKQ